MRGTAPVLTGWTLLIRFDDGSVAELEGSQGPAELRGPSAWVPARSIRGRVGDTLHGLGVAARRLSAGPRVDA